MKKQEIQVIETYNTHDYRHELDMYLSWGYKIITANIEGNRFMAILTKDCDNMNIDNLKNEVKNNTRIK